MPPSAFDRIFSEGSKTYWFAPQDFVKIGEPGIDDDYGLDDLPALLYFAQVDINNSL